MPNNKTVRLGSGIVFPMAGGGYLFERNEGDCPDHVRGKLRPCGGGKEPKDANLFETAVRELEEELDIPEWLSRRNLKYLGKIKSGPYKSCAMFSLHGHGLSPGRFHASNDPNEKVMLVHSDFDDPKYIGAQLEDLDETLPPWHPDSEGDEVEGRGHYFSAEKCRALEDRYISQSQILAFRKKEASDKPKRKTLLESIIEISTNDHAKGSDMMLDHKSAADMTMDDYMGSAELVGSRGRARMFGRPEPEDRDKDYAIFTDDREQIDKVTRFLRNMEKAGFDITEWGGDRVTASGKGMDLNIYPTAHRDKIHAAWKLMEAGKTKQQAWDEIEGRKSAADLISPPQGPIMSGGFTGLGGPGRWTEDEFDYEIPSPSHQFTAGVNLIPGASAMKGARLGLSAKYLSQALPLEIQEAPLVDSMDPETGESFSAQVARDGGIRTSPIDGEVLSAGEGIVKIRGADGKHHEVEMHQYFPNGRKSFIHDRAVVKPGDKIKAGQAVAMSNSVSDDGRLAIGRNLRVAFQAAPYGGTFEDAITISEGAAKKLSSQQLYSFDTEIGQGKVINKERFVSMFPNRYTKDQLSKIGDNGLPLPGVTINPGDPVVLAMSPRVLSKEDAALGRLGRMMRDSWKDESEDWTKEKTGLVTDSVLRNKASVVKIASTSVASVGDKLSARQGSKGVIGKILPDDTMPRDANGEPIEIFINTAALIGRVNPAMVFEAMLGKVAEKTGKPVFITSFGQKKVNEFVEEALARNGLNAEETLYDPETGRPIGDILVGKQHFLKLEHVADCFDDQTEVLTNQGWKKWEEVKPWDEIATSDTRGGSLFFEKPLHLVNYRYTGKMYGFSGKYVDYMVTPNHNLWCKVYHGAGRIFGLRQAAEMHGRMFAIKQFGFATEEQDRIPEENKKIGSVDINWGDFCSLVGWWVAEGCISRCGKVAIIYQSSTANPKKLMEIKHLVDRIGLRRSEYRSDGVEMGVCIHDRDLAAYLSGYGLKCEKKRIPREILLGSTSGIKSLVHAMMKGDGNMHQKPRKGEPIGRYTSVSVGLLDDFQEAMIRCGWGGQINMDNPMMKKYENEKLKLAGTCGFTKTRKSSLVDGKRNKKSFSVVDYDGIVYCAEMRTGLLYVRRNGKPMLSGNSKVSARSSEGGYDINGLPSKGGEEGGKRVGGLLQTALLSHGALGIVGDAKLRASDDPEIWRNIRNGLPLPPQREHKAFTKFLDMMRASGVRVDKKRDSIDIRLLLDRDVEEMNPQPLGSGKSVDRDGTFVAGGLEDPAVFGGATRRGWSVIDLPFPVPHPLAERQVAHLLGITGTKMSAVMEGKDTIGGKKGPGAIKEALAGIDLDKLQANKRMEAKGGSRTRRDAAIKTLRAIRGLQNAKIRPEELMVSRIPVLPAAWRPVVNAGEQILVPDVNLLYGDLHNAVDAWGSIQKSFGGGVDARG